MFRRPVFVLRNFALVLVLLICFSSEAKTLVVPYPGLIEQEGLLQPSVLLGKPGLSLEGLASRGPIPSRFSIAGAFPLFRQDTLRGSGWMWALRAGVTEFMYEEDNVFAAGQYYFEAGLGRGTTAPIFEDRSGLRGYMEFSFRTERPRYSRRVGEVSSYLGTQVLDRKNFVSLKIGAGSSLDSDGLVLQKPGNWGNRVQMQIYLPVTDKSGSVVNVMLQGYRLCPSQRWLCGWHLSYQHHYQTSQGMRYDELSDLLGAGFFVNFYKQEDFNISTRVTWTYVGNASHKGFEALPLAHLHMTKRF